MEDPVAISSSLVDAGKFVSASGVLIWVVSYFMRSNEQDRKDHKCEVDKIVAANAVTVEALVTSHDRALDLFEENNREEARVHDDLRAALRRIEDNQKTAM